MAVYRDIDSSVRIQGDLTLPNGSVAIGSNAIVLNHTNGNITAASFTGDGSGLTNLLATNMAGVLLLDGSRAMKGSLVMNNNQIRLRTSGDTNHYISYTLNDIGGTSLDGVRIAGFSGVEIVKSNGSKSLATFREGDIQLRYKTTISGDLYANNLYENGTLISSKYALQTTTISAGSGLTGGGDLSTNRTLSVNFTSSGGDNGTATTVARGDHLHDSRYLRLTGGTLTGALVVDGGGGVLSLKPGASSDHVYIQFYADSQAASTRSGYVGYPSSGTTTFTIANEMTNGNINFIVNGTGIVTIGGNKVWHQGNDGTGSGLDADLLDGIDSTGFLRRNADTDTTGKITITRDGDAIELNKNTTTSYSGITFKSKGNLGSDYAFIRYYDDAANFSATYDIGGGNSENGLLVIGVENEIDLPGADLMALRVGKKLIIDAANIAATGSPSNIVEFRNQGVLKSYIDPNGKYMGDVDKLDGLHASQFLRSDINTTFTGSTLTLSNNSDVTLHINADVDDDDRETGNAILRLSVDGGTTTTLLKMDQNGNAFRIDSYTNYNGSTGTYQPVFTFNGNTVWHAGNLDPTTKVDKTTTITAGNGLVGGGDLSANRTLSVDFAGTGIANTVARSDHHHDGTYAPLNHNHDSTYLKLVGGSLTGTLNVGGAGVRSTASSGDRGFGLDSRTASAIGLFPGWSDTTLYINTYSNAGSKTDSYANVEIGGNASFRGSVTSAGSLTVNNTSYLNGLTFITATSGSAEALSLKAGDTVDSVYMAFFADSQAQGTRSGRIGYTTGSSATLTIQNEMTNGGIDILPNGTGVINLAGAVILGAQATSTNHAVRADRSILAGTGLTGGGNLTADRTLSVNFGGSGSATTVARSDHNHDSTYVKLTGGTMTGRLQFGAGQDIAPDAVSGTAPTQGIRFSADTDIYDLFLRTDNVGEKSGLILALGDNPDDYFQIEQVSPAGEASPTVLFKISEAEGANFTTTLKVNGNTVWHAGNDGAGSGLDADTVDGLQASQLVRNDTDQSINANLSIKSIANNDGLSTHIPVVGGGGYRATSSTVTGAIKITLPQSWTNTMMQFAVDIYEFATGESFTVIIGGYNYAASSQWYNPTAIIIGAKTDRNFTVRFGHDGSKCCVYIGELSSTWSYPLIRVRDFMAGYLNYSADMWKDGWSVGFESTAFGTISQTVTTTLPIASYSLDADKLDGLNSTQFLRSDTSGTLTGDLSLTGYLQNNNCRIRLGASAWGQNNGEAKVLGEIHDSNGTSGNSRLMIYSGTGKVNLYIDGDIYVDEGRYKVWHAGNLSPVINADNQSTGNNFTVRGMLYVGQSGATGDIAIHDGSTGHTIHLDGNGSGKINASTVKVYLKGNGDAEFAGTVTANRIVITDSSKPLVANLNAELLNGKKDRDFDVPITNTDIGGWGVVSGLELKATQVPSSDVLITAGVVYTSSGRRFDIAQHQLPQPPASATYDRWDAIYVQGPSEVEGQTKVLQGVASATPVKPSIPADGVLLGYVYRRTNVNDITDGTGGTFDAIEDARMWKDVRYTRGSGMEIAGYTKVSGNIYEKGVKLEDKYAELNADNVFNSSQVINGKVRIQSNTGSLGGSPTDPDYVLRVGSDDAHYIAFDANEMLSTSDLTIGAATDMTIKVGANNLIALNGKVKAAKNAATVTIPAGQTSAVWTHNYGSTSYVISLAPNSFERHVRWTNKNANNITIEIDDPANQDILVDCILIGY